jgi:hypothetical protein
MDQKGIDRKIYRDVGVQAAASAYADLRVRIDELTEALIKRNVISQEDLKLDPDYRRSLYDLAEKGFLDDVVVKIRPFATPDP